MIVALAGYWEVIRRGVADLVDVQQLARCCCQRDAAGGVGYFVAGSGVIRCIRRLRIGASLMGAIR